jgi:hypothetical protein
VLGVLAQQVMELQAHLALIQFFQLLPHLVVVRVVVMVSQASQAVMALLAVLVVVVIAKSHQLVAQETHLAQSHLKEITEVLAVLLQTQRLAGAVVLAQLAVTELLQ